MNRKASFALGLALAAGVALTSVLNFAYPIKAAAQPCCTERDLLAYEVLYSINKRGRTDVEDDTSAKVYIKLLNNIYGPCEWSDMGFKCEQGP